MTRKLHFQLSGDDFDTFMDIMTYVDDVEMYERTGKGKPGRLYDRWTEEQIDAFHALFDDMLWFVEQAEMEHQRKLGRLKEYVEELEKLEK